MNVKIEFNVDNSAFHPGDCERPNLCEVCNVIHLVANKIETENRCFEDDVAGIVRDSNGNKIGKYVIS